MFEMPWKKDLQKVAADTMPKQLRDAILLAIAHSVPRLEILRRVQNEMVLRGYSRTCERVLQVAAFLGIERMVK